MNAQEQIGKLQGLLARIQRNAAQPRVVHPGSPAPSAADQSVDDLLDAAPASAPIPEELDVPLDSVPPEADAEPIPLVAATSQAATGSEEPFSVESEVSEVRFATGVREPSAEVTVEAIAAEAEPMVPEELSEDDLVEVTEATSVPPAAQEDVDIDFEDEEEPPASSQRKVASSMDEALAAAAEQLEGEREVPIKTPPPESGPQAAPLPAGIAAPAAPDVDALLGQEADIPTHAAAAAAQTGPTPEQLGQTIELEEAAGPALELAEHPAEAEPSAKPAEELELPLPGRTQSGYHEDLAPPPEAREDLEAHRRRLEEEAIPPPPESLAQAPSLQPGPASAEPAAVGPEVVARPLPTAMPHTFGAPRDSFQPASFVELLDASLSL